MNEAFTLYWDSEEGCITGKGLHISDADDLYMVGGFSGVMDFDPGPPTDELSNSDDCYDLSPYLLKLNTFGNYFWKTSWDYPMDNGEALDAATFGNDIVYVCGYFDKTSVGTDNSFFTKFDSEGVQDWDLILGFNDSGYATSVEVDYNGNPIFAGYWQDELDWDPGPGEDIRQTNGYYDAYLYKLLPNGLWEW